MVNLVLGCNQREGGRKLYEFLRGITSHNRNNSHSYVVIIDNFQLSKAYKGKNHRAFFIINNCFFHFELIKYSSCKMT